MSSFVKNIPHILRWNIAIIQSGIVLKRLVVNADDFGFTADVNEGIVEAHRNGILTATTLMANGDAFDDAARLAAAVPTMDITSLAGELSNGFIDPPSFVPTMKALEGQRLALLVGGGCGNRVTATVALHRTGHKSIVELPGAVAA